MIPIIRDAIHLRYKLLPYLYRLSYESHISGIPIIRPLFLEFQLDEKTFDTSFDFMLGPYLLVSSVTEPNLFEKLVYLPGTCSDYWYNFWNDEIYHGNQTVTVKVPLSQHGAVFARHGSIIPMGKCMKFVGSEPDDLRIILLFPVICNDSKSIVNTTTLYEDDGLTNSGKNYIIKITTTTDNNSIKLRVEAQNNGFTPDYEKLMIKIPNGEKRNVECSSHVLEVIDGVYYLKISA